MRLDLCVAFFVGAVSVATPISYFLVKHDRDDTGRLIRLLNAASRTGLGSMSVDELLAGVELYGVDLHLDRPKHWWRR